MNDPQQSVDNRGSRNSRFRALIQLSLTRWRSFYREPGTVFWTFGFPIVLSIALGVAFRNRPPEAVVVCIEAGPGAEELKTSLVSTGQVKAFIEPANNARSLLNNGKVSLVVVPGEPRSYRFDPTRPESRLSRLVVDDLLQRAAGRTDTVATVDEHVTEPGSRYIDFLLPGLIGLGLMSSGLWGIGYTIVDLRARKLIKRMVATPMRRVDFLLAFVLMRAVFLLGELPILVSFGAFVFNVPVRGSLFLLFGVATLGALVFAGIGLLVASRAENTTSVNGVINLVTMPMFIASGTFFSASRFPDVVQPVVRLLPLTALNDALRAVMLEGAGVLDIKRSLIILLAWGAAAFAAALKLFRWR